MHSENLYSQTLQSPVGDLHLLAHDSALLAVAFKNNSAKVFERIVPPGVEPHHSCSPILELAHQQLQGRMGNKLHVLVRLVQRVRWAQPMDSTLCVSSFRVIGSLHAMAT